MDVTIAIGQRDVRIAIMTMRLEDPLGTYDFELTRPWTVIKKNPLCMLTKDSYICMDLGKID